MGNEKKVYRFRFEEELVNILKEYIKNKDMQNHETVGDGVLDVPLFA